MRKLLSGGLFSRPRESTTPGLHEDLVVGHDGGPSKGAHSETLDAVIERARARQLAAVERAAIAQQERDDFIASDRPDASSGAREAHERRSVAAVEATTLLRQIRVLESVRDEYRATMRTAESQDDGHLHYRDDGYDNQTNKRTAQHDRYEVDGADSRKRPVGIQRDRRSNPVDEAVMNDVEHGWRDTTGSAEVDKANAHASRLDRTVEHRDAIAESEQAEIDGESLRVEEEAEAAQQKADEAREEVREAMEMVNRQTQDTLAVQSILEQSVNPYLDEEVDGEIAESANRGGYQPSALD